jgi:hypothetical protein
VTRLGNLLFEGKAKISGRRNIKRYQFSKYLLEKSRSEFDRMAVRQVIVRNGTVR